MQTYVENLIKKNIFLEKLKYLCLDDLIIKNDNMKELEEMVYKIIGKTTKKELAKELGITFPTLQARLKKGGWKNTEIEIIKNLYDRL